MVVLDLCSDRNSLLIVLCMKPCLCIWHLIKSQHWYKLETVLVCDASDIEWEIRGPLIPTHLSST